MQRTEDSSDEEDDDEEERRVRWPSSAGDCDWPQVKAIKQSSLSSSDTRSGCRDTAAP